VAGVTSFTSGSPLGIGYSLVSGADIVGGGAGVDDFGIGNASKDPIRGPGINVFDVSVYKNIPFSSNEHRKLQLRFEFYNFFNHASFQGVDTSGRFDAQGKQVNATFGAYTSTLDARRVVLEAKVYF
jgi:hypothetical protein